MAQAQGPQLPLADLGRQLAGLVQFGQQVAGLGEERFTGGRQARQACGALEQRGLQQAFQFLDLPAQG